MKLGGAGTQTTGLSFGGLDEYSELSSVTEEYNDSTVGGRYYFYTSNNENVIILNEAKQTVFNLIMVFLVEGNFNLIVVGFPMVINIKQDLFSMDLF